MTDGVTLVIGPRQLADALGARPEAHGTELVVFPEDHVREAVEIIVRRRPRAVFVQELFAQSPRGTALTHRIAIDAQLTHTKVLVVSADGTVAPVESPVTPRWLPLDTSGTRRVPRIRIRAGVSVQIDGTTAELVDLSTKGAQVLSATVLKPNQRVRVVLSIEPDTTRAVGPVAWATFELLKGTPEPRYRAGIEFSVAEAEPILRFCLMHADDSAPPRSG